MSGAELAAIFTAAPALLAAIAAFIAQVRHANNPNAHGGQGHAPNGKQ